MPRNIVLVSKKQLRLIHLILFSSAKRCISSLIAWLTQMPEHASEKMHDCMFHSTEVIWMIQDPGTWKPSAVLGLQKVCSMKKLMGYILPLGSLENKEELKPKTRAGGLPFQLFYTGAAC